ncbi:hypothetical protein INT43_003774 [Umbelopsis isabellina]|uniref:SAM-dependent MTase RsmB/NOP-type domain-containing protein n=1 Tax=Mortierella isabellina TaxID=91625 RepID=A0A8H7PTF6_MORIS|nr:hypothetical protein INT43_003774 [Umbelopsis isabellina]
MDLASLPAAFSQFLEENSVDPIVYTVKNLPRFVRWNTRFPKTELPTAEELQAQLNGQRVWPVEGIEGFFGIQLLQNQDTEDIDGSNDNDDIKSLGLRIIDIPAYQQNKIFGIDVSSGIAVLALQVQPDDHVLDLCCAPGAKLCMISNILGSEGTGTVTGVDISSHRVATCRSLVKRYKVAERVRLFNADGITFGVHAPSRIGAKILKKDDSIQEPSEKKRKGNDEVPVKTVERINPFHAPKTLRFDPQLRGEAFLYDKVIVDAECTHDGSILHILKYEKWGWDTFEKNFMDKDRLRDICQLQRNLMANAWSLLVDDGLMVYSTCSLSIKQNEENVAWFLHVYGKEAILENIPCISDIDIKSAPIKQGWQVPELPENNRANIELAIESNCIRFDPIVSGTSGFFVALFRKRRQCQEEQLVHS